jgi:uncharacterized protein (TIGR02271 family)
MRHTLIAVFDNRTDAQNAKAELLESGFNESDIRLNEDSSAGSHFMDSAGSTASTSATEGGIGSSIKNFFADIFGDDSDTKHHQIYTTAVERGNYALTITTTSEDDVERAADIVEGFGPVDIDEKAAEWGGAAQGPSSMADIQPAYTAQRQGPAASASAVAAAGNSQSASAGGSQQRDVNAEAAIPVVEEQIKVGKREVQRGGVRVYSRVVETPVQESVSLREEQVHVERRPVDQLIDPANAAAFQEQTVELREMGEEAVVQKTARVVEEVVVSKDVAQRQESISDTVRHTEVQVEQLGAQNAGNDSAFRTHWNSNYAPTGEAYESYAPAYSYGSDMANQYQGRQWNDVENDLRSNWDARNAGGASTWEQFKGAVRHGWDSMTR